MSSRGMLRLAGAGAAAAMLTAALSGTASAGEQSAAVIANFYIQRAGTSVCLDSNTKGDVYTLKCNEGRNQAWTNFAPGKFRNLETNACLAASRTAVFTTSCSSNTTDWTTSSTTNKYFKNVQTGLCLNNSGGSPEAVGVRICHAPTALWTVERA
ncbi:ricin-type beta-trefoil lectin domain protein [Amycolatopsis sp. NPDC004079]|uniref:RICIN domain-containing protein n=1 Tax=Amycolatopsis sp. NPDC004079 TaxID=3154549 RepID=UPI0033BE081E